jgi:5-methylcytosine-specific restriction endonuclease McrA
MRRKYCSKECRPKPPLKAEHPTHCLQCQTALPSERKSGQPRKYCGRECKEAATLVRLREKRQRQLSCDECQKEFVAAGQSRRFCSKVCRLENARKTKAEKVRNYFANLYPDGIKTKTCRWCNQPMEVSAKRSYAGRLYHPDCSKEAERARYRIKTVKRQSRLVKPSRLAADEVVRTYGSNCHICNLPIDLSLPRTSKLGLTVDHVIPISKDGPDTIENMRPAHWSCNRKKWDKLPEELNA